MLALVKKGGLEFTKESDSSSEGATSGNEVINDDSTLTRLNRTYMHLYLICSILQRILLRDHLPCSMKKPPNDAFIRINKQGGDIKMVLLNKWCLNDFNKHISRNFFKIVQNSIANNHLGYWKKENDRAG